VVNLDLRNPATTTAYEACRSAVPQLMALNHHPVVPQAS
jgi:hypothetical protein